MLVSTRAVILTFKCTLKEHGQINYLIDNVIPRSRDASVGRVKGPPINIVGAQE